MHDPMVVVFDLHLPIPRHRRWGDAKPGERRWTLGRRRRTNAENLGQPVYRWWRVAGYEPRVAGRALALRELATVWHIEPEGRDSGTICKGMLGSDFNWHNVKWAWAHRAHLEVHFQFPRKVKRWLSSRCDDCGKRFFWREARFGYMSSDKVYHQSCQNLRSAKGQLEDATKVIQFRATDTERWRVERRLDHLTDKDGR